MRTQTQGPRADLVAMVADDPQRLRRRSISLGVAPDDADDVAQTVLLRAWRGVEQLHDLQPGRLCAWLDTIARNAVIDLARQRARRPIVALDADDDQVAGTASVSHDVETRVLLDAVLRAINDLPETLRRPLLMSVADELSAAEIAERLDITVATARQRISRARKALAGCREAGMSETSCDLAASARL